MYDTSNSPVFLLPPTLQGIEHPHTRLLFMAADDRHRFMDDASFINKAAALEVGTYAGDLVPAAQLHTATGVARGEHLFARPEMKRPWRTQLVQRHAEVIVVKEQEIEILTRQCTDLRYQMAQMQRENHQRIVVTKTDYERVIKEKDAEIVKLKSVIDELKRDGVQRKTESDHQLRILRAQLEAEIARVQTKAKFSADALASMAGTYAQQMDDVKAAATREVELVQQLC